MHWLKERNKFTLQFQSFCIYKSNPQKRDRDDFDKAPEHDVEESIHDVRLCLFVAPLIYLHLQAWDVYAILNMLYSLVERSQIREQLSAVNKGGKLVSLVSFSCTSTSQSPSNRTISV